MIIGCSQAIRCYVCVNCDTPSGAQECGANVTQCVKGAAEDVGK